MKAVDQLGAVQAQIAELRKVEAQLKSAVIFGGEDTEGELFKATIVESERKVTDWKKIANDLGASAQKIRANTAISHVVSLRVVARSTAARKAA